MYTYTLIPGGYEIYLNSTHYIHQPYAPGEQGMRPLSREESEILATELIAELEAAATAPPTE